MQYANPLKFQGWHTLLNVSALSFSLPDSAYCNFYHYRGDFAHRVDRNVLLVGLVDFRSEAYPAVHEAFNRKGIRARGELAAYDAVLADGEAFGQGAAFGKPYVAEGVALCKGDVYRLICGCGELFRFVVEVLAAVYRRCITARRTDAYSVGDATLRLLSGCCCTSP